MKTRSVFIYESGEFSYEIEITSGKQASLEMWKFKGSDLVESIDLPLCDLYAVVKKYVEEGNRIMESTS